MSAADEVLQKLRGQNCNHAGFLVPTLFRQIGIPNPKVPLNEEDPKMVSAIMTVQAFCVQCRQNIKFEMPPEHN